MLPGWKGILIGIRLWMIAFKPMLLLIKPILFKFLQSEGVQKMVIEILEAYVKKTYNSIDHQLVGLVRQSLFPSK